MNKLDPPRQFFSRLTILPRCLTHHIVANSGFRALYVSWILTIWVLWRWNCVNFINKSILWSYICIVSELSVGMNFYFYNFSCFVAHTNSIFHLFFLCYSIFFSEFARSNICQVFSILQQRKPIQCDTVLHKWIWTQIRSIASTMILSNTKTFQIDRLVRALCEILPISSKNVSTVHWIFRWIQYEFVEFWKKFEFIVCVFISIRQLCINTISVSNNSHNTSR